MRVRPEGVRAKARINPSLSAKSPAKAGFLHSGRDEKPKGGFENGSAVSTASESETAPKG